MFDSETYMHDMVAMLQARFGDKLLYVGLQGSYLRGEATEHSDIDVVVVLDKLSPNDLNVYKEIVNSQGDPQKSCGFLCGVEELQNWNTLEICNFRFGTKDYYGVLADYLPAYSDADVVSFIKLSVGNLYHEIVHRYVHADRQANISGLPFAYKNVFFILQSKYYLQTGVFFPTKTELLCHLAGQDRDVMERALRIANGAPFDFDTEFDTLLAWCQTVLRSV